MDLLVLLLFSLLLIGCVIFDISILIALFAGYFLFAFVALRKGFSLKEVLQMSFDGIKTVKNILITFLLIGTLTAVWRASGCIPTIVCMVSGFLQPSVFILLTFLLCALLSFLTGTSFGTAATMGMICMSIANSMQIPVFWMGGAILCGSFWGDRCSPVSTSALLVSTITKTDLYDNLKRMLKTCLVPSLFTCVIYLIAGSHLYIQDGSVDVPSLFASEFSIQPVCLLPAVVILVLALIRMDVKKAMLLSVLTGIIIALAVQKMDVFPLLRTLVLGFEAKDSELSSLINGGGLVSMLRVTAIVCIASCYSGIFQKTGLLDFLYEKISVLSKHIGNFPTVVLLSIPASAIACNQSLAIMLTRQLASRLDSSKEDLALYLENSAVLIAPLIPWSIAGGVPLSSVGAPTVCILSACYLYLVPFWNLLLSFRKCRKSSSIR